MSILRHALLPSRAERMARELAATPEPLRDLLRALNAGSIDNERPRFVAVVEGPLSPTEAMFILRGVWLMSVLFDFDDNHWERREEALSRLVGGIDWPDEKTVRS